MLRTERWKLVHVPKPGGGEDRLYDLRADPGETQDVAGEHPEVVKRMRAEIDFMIAREPAAGGRAEGSLSDDEREQLKALGYL